MNQEHVIYSIEDILYYVTERRVRTDEDYRK